MRKPDNRSIPSSPDAKPPSFFLYEPERAEWIRLFDGFTLGQARGSEKFAVDLEKSANHCAFQLSPDGQEVRLLDLGSPGGIILNDGCIPFATETRLEENDRLRIGQREFVLTRGKVLPGPQRAKKEPPKAPVEPAPLNPGASPRSRRSSLSDVRGAPEGALARAGDRIVRAYDVFLELARSSGAAALSLLRWFLDHRNLREPLLAAALMAALIAWKLSSHPARAPEPVAPKLAASDTLLPRAPLESRAPDARSPLPPPGPPLSLRAALQPGPDVAVPPVQAVPAPARVIASAFPPPGSPTLAPAPRLPPTPPERLPTSRVAVGGTAAPVPQPPSQVAPKPHPTFEMIPIGSSPFGAAPMAEEPPDPETAAMQPAEAAPPAQIRTGMMGFGQSVALHAPEAGIDFKITAISVMNTDARTTRFQDYVSANTVVSAFTNMNQNRAPSSTPRRFEQPSISRDGGTYRLDWCDLWENQCGKPAADAFCQEQGLSSAASFQMAPGVGGPDQPTAIIGQSGVSCPGTHPGHRCDGFSYIECAP